MRFLETAVTILLAAILVAGLLFEGFGRNDFTRAVVFLLCGLAGVWALFKLRTMDKAQILSLRPLFYVVGFFIFFAFCHLIFLIPLPIKLLSILSPAWAGVIQNATQSGVELPDYLPLGIAPELGWRSFNQTVACGCFLLAAGVVMRRRKFSRTLLFVVAAVAVLEGWIGAYGYLVLDFDRARGALFNPNHHAAAVIMGLPIAAALIFNGRINTRGRISLATEQRDLRLLAGALVTIAAFGWIFSFSRGSLFSGAVMISVWLLWEYRIKIATDGQTRRFTGIAFLSVCLAIPLVITATTLLEGFSDRFTQAGEGLIGRTELWGASLEGLWESNLLGMGPGGTEYAINRFLTSTATRKIPVWAHNDYVQFFADFGIIALAGACVFLTKWLRSLSRSFKDASRGNDPRGHLVERAALVGMGTVLAHSLLDFPLRIPMVAFSFLALCAYVSAMDARAERRSPTLSSAVQTNKRERRVSASRKTEVQV